MKKKYFILILSFILLIAAFFRFTGLNWDENQHLNPDERFLTMVTEAMQWPKTVIAYFDTQSSALNPHNIGYQFFVYGTWPLIVVKGASEVLHMDSYNGITLVGRVLSGCIDLLTLLFVFLIARKIFKPSALFAVFFYATMALPIQLSHFFTTDPYTTFLCTIVLYLLLFPLSFFRILLLGATLGLAFAAKISAVIIFPLVFCVVIYRVVKMRNVFKIVFYIVLFFLALFLTTRISLPYLFDNTSLFSISLNQRVISNWTELKRFDDPTGWYPPAVQWIKTLPYIFPFWNMLWIGLGLPMGLLALSSSLYFFWETVFQLIQKKRTKNLNTFTDSLGFSVKALWVILLWTLLVFLFQGAQFAKALRYFYPIYPALSIISGLFVASYVKRYHPSKLTLFVFSLLFLVWPLAVSSIYQKPNTRVAASYWIYNHIPPGSRTSTEHWDDALPLRLADKNFSYEQIEFPLYNPDTGQKVEVIREKLENVDYIILTSNRLYASITSFPEKYPITTAYYKALFDGRLGFVKIAEFTSRPSLPLPFNMCVPLPYFSYGAIASSNAPCQGIAFIDDFVDETWTVYDHPKVTIFQKTHPVNYRDILLRGMKKEVNTEIMPTL